jgi:hypothetical protein
MRRVPSAQPTTSDRPCSANFSRDAPPIPSPIVASSRPVATSHTFTVPSTPVEASVRPSGLKHAKLVPPGCPSSFRASFHVRASQITIPPRAGPHIHRPSREKSKLCTYPIDPSIVVSLPLATSTTWRAPPAVDTTTDFPVASKYVV